jgi:hypothetical protein
LDVAAVERCHTSGKYKAAVQKDIDDGRVGGVTGTPAFFVNDRLLSGAALLDKFVESGISLYNHSTKNPRLSSPAGCARLIHGLAHYPPHCSEMNAKFFCDLLIAVGTGLVGRPNCVIPIFLSPSYHAELGRRAPLLHFGDVNILLPIA